jgi:hypothetical protein
MEISLTTKEKELLIDVLEERHRELLREISRTTHNQFKLALKDNEKLLRSVIDKLRETGSESLSSIPA